MFQVNEWYENRRGKYQVLSIRGDAMRVRYADGSFAEASAATQERILQNQAIQVQLTARKLPSGKVNKTYGFYFLLGFLAGSNAKLLAFIPEHALPSFEDVWYDATGKNLPDGQKGVVIHPPDTDKRWYECRITFAARPQQLKQLEFHVPELSFVSAGGDGNWNINNNKLFFVLVEYGFCVGGDQSVGHIQAIIPEAYTSAFTDGVLAVG